MMKNERDLLKEIERLNLEVIELTQSKEYVLGKKLLHFKSLMKKLKLVTILKKIIQSKKIGPMMIGQKKDNMNYSYIKQTAFLNSNQLAKIAVYTCITGDYDEIPHIYLKEDSCDYYLITNNPKITSDEWKVLYIEEEKFKEYNNSMLNRYFKLHPTYYFKDYDYAFYLDGNINIISTLSDLISKMDLNVGLSMHQHKDRNCVYEEVKACKILKKGNYEKLEQLVQFYEKKGFPKNYGMLECSIIFIHLKNKLSLAILEEWWELFVKSECGRDQMILPYILFKRNIDIEKVAVLGNNLYKNSKFRVFTHKQRRDLI